MNLLYKQADISDLDLLTETRITVLLAANHLKEDTDMSQIRMESRTYYTQALESDTHIACLVFDGSVWAGTGGISFFQVMPTFHNPTGRKAYIMNMYTKPAYRRQGIAYHTLNLLVDAAKARGITAISLEATAMGRPLYEAYGFTGMNDEMELLLPQSPTPKSVFS